MNRIAAQLHRLSAAGLLLSQAATATIAHADEVISHGPILGRVSAHSVGVWARTARPSRFSVRYGRSPDVLDQFAGPVATTPGHDNTGWVQIDNLSPNTRYYYQLVGARGLLDESEIPVRSGTFRTLPDDESYRDPELNPEGLFNFAFEFGCGNNQNPGQGGGPALPTFNTMLQNLTEKVHFSMQNGDWLYEDQREYSLTDWANQVGLTGAEIAPAVEIAPTIVGVWENYKIYLARGKNLAAYHRHMPTFFTFDDHEILNDVWGAGTPGNRNRRAVFRDVGVRAWYDYLGWSNPVTFDQHIRFGRAQLSGGGDLLVDENANFSSLNLDQTGTLHIHWGGETAGVNDNALDGVGGDPNAGVYEIVEIIDDHRLRIQPVAKEDGVASYSIGRLSHYRFRVANCDFFVLDTRSHRQLHDTSQPDKPGLSMLAKDSESGCWTAWNLATPIFYSLFPA